MYTVECDDVIIYDDTSLLQDTVITDPKLELADNSAGKFTSTLYSNNRGYNTIKKYTSTIIIKKDAKWLWEGRVLLENIYFQNRKQITCEGAMAYLNDVLLPPKKYQAATAGSLLNQLLEFYNSRITSSKRRISLGGVTVDSSSITEFETAYESVFSFIQSNLVDQFGGHLFMTKDSSGLKLNYYKDYPNQCSQTIDFGVNLLDFTKNYDFSNIITVVIPRGKQIDTGETEEVSEGVTRNKNAYLTIADVNNGSIYLENSTTVKTYGRIEKTVDFSDVEDPNKLLTLGREYLSSVQFDDMTLTIKAIDLHVLNSSVETLKLLDEVRCVSLPHGLD